ncbi:MAG: protein YgfX [Pseudomonadota bacterium]
MSSNNFASTIDLSPGPSMRAFKLVFWLHVIPIAILPFAMKEGPMMLTLLALIALSWFSLRRHSVFGFGLKALTRLTWHAEGGWTVRDQAGEYSAELQGNSFVHSAFLVLNFRLKNGARRTRVLMGDEVDAEQMRQLRARLSVFKSEQAN